MSTNRRWRTGGHRPGLVVLVGSGDLSRVGNCWMKGRLRQGDVAMCLQHRGDCFWDYALLRSSPIEILVDSNDRFLYRLIRESEFGAYTLGTPYERWQPTEREYHLLLAGESVAGEPLL